MDLNVPGLLDDHPVLYFLHTVYVFGEFGGQLDFGCVAGLAMQCNHTILRHDLGIEGTGRAVIEQRHRYFFFIIRFAGFFSPISMCIFFMFLNCSSVMMPRISFMDFNISR